MLAITIASLDGRLHRSPIPANCHTAPAAEEIDVSKPTPHLSPLELSFSGLNSKRLFAGLTRRAAIVCAGALLLTPSLALAQLKSGPELAAELAKEGPRGDIVLGKADAPVTMVEYASMTCGHCATFHNTVLPKLKEKYISTGKVRLILREFPLDNLAAAGSMLARCAGGTSRLRSSRRCLASRRNGPSSTAIQCRRCSNS